jgi:transcriptional regulator with XRE-family HTH domain
MANDIKPRPNRLKSLRERSRLTQKELAKLMDCDFTTISKHESAERGLTKDEIKKYAAIFKCASYELFIDPQLEAPIE